MMNIIKTAVITIVISFISGFLLDYYKNLAPKILSTVKSTVPIRDNKKIYAYIITIANISNKTIHELTLNMQSPNTNIKILNSKITRGLKFDFSKKFNTLDVSIPFLNSDDKFSVTVCADNPNEIINKPVIVIKSPEKFKQVSSLQPSNIFDLLLNIPNKLKKTFSKSKHTSPNYKNDFTQVMDNPLASKSSLNNSSKRSPHKNTNINRNKKILIVLTSIVLVVFIGFLGKTCFKTISSNIKAHASKIKIPKQSTDVKKSSTEDNSKNSSTKNQNINENNNGNSNTQNNNSVPNTNNNTSNNNSTENSGSKASDNNSTQDKTSKPSNEDTNKTIDSNTTNKDKEQNSDSDTTNDDTTNDTNSDTTNENVNPDTNN